METPNNQTTNLFIQTPSPLLRQNYFNGCNEFSNHTPSSLNLAYTELPISPDILQQEEKKVAIKRKFNPFVFAEALRELKEEENLESSKKYRTDFPFLEKTLSKRLLYDDESLMDSSGCKKRRSKDLEGVRKVSKDMIDEFFMSSSFVTDEIDEFFTSSSIPKPVKDKTTDLRNQFTTSFAHILSKEYFDRTTFENRYIFTPKKLSNETYFDSEFVNKEKIGEGEFSEAFKCAVEKTRNLCIVKKSKLPFKGPLDRQDRLEEVNIHYKAGSHKNIVELTSAWEQRGYLYLQIELCETGSLADLIKERKKNEETFSEEEIWQVISDIKSAFIYMHGKSIVHLDVKPENILIKKTNAQNIYKLADFGCATLLPPRKWFDKDGDRRYISNDALNGTYSPGADWFSLGITVIELATLRQMEGNGDIYQRLRRGNFSDYKDQLLTYSEKLKKAIKVMLSPNHKGRYVDSSFGI